MTHNDEKNRLIFASILAVIVIFILGLNSTYEFGKNKAIENSYNLFSQVKIGSEMKSIDDSVTSSKLNFEYNVIISGTNSVIKELIVGPLKLYLWFENGVLMKMENKIE